MSSPAKAPTAGFSPLPGCVIFIAGGVVLLFMLIWGVYTFRKTAEEVIGFTDEKPLSIAKSPVSPEQWAGIERKILDFESQVINGKGGKAHFTLEEINQLMAGDEKRFGELPKMIRFLSADAGGAGLGDLSIPLNTYPGRPVRWLNATLKFRFAATLDRGLSLITDDVILKDPTKKLSEGFLVTYRQNGNLDEMLLKSFRDDRRVGRVLKKIYKAELTPQGLSLEATEGIPPEPEDD